LDSQEQQILADFYNSLTKKGILGWDVSSDLCGQYGVICDDSNPQRVIYLYLIIVSSNGDTTGAGVKGTLPTTLGALTSLQEM